MIRAGLALGLAVVATVCSAETRDEEFLVWDRMVLIRAVDSFEILTVGPNEYDQMQVLSGADVEVLATVGDDETIALLGQPVVVARVFGSHSCDTGEAWLYYLVTLGAPPMPEGPVSSCADLAVSIEPGAVVLQAEGEAWAWAAGQGFVDRAR
jgi:hypothetical protein